MAENSEEPLVLEVVRHKGEWKFKLVSGKLVDYKTKRPRKYSPTHVIVNWDSAYIDSYYVAVKRGDEIIHFRRDVRAEGRRIESR